MAGEYQLTVSRASGDIVNDVGRLFAAEDDPKHESLIRWQYSGPSGDAYVGVARLGSSTGQLPAALYPTLPVTMHVHGKTMTGCQSVDTLTGSPHRGRGLFVKLGRAVYERLCEDGVAMAFGFPNDAVLPGRRDRLNWQIFDPVPMWVRPVGLRYAQVRARLRKPAAPAKQGSLRLEEIPKDVGNLYLEVAGVDSIGVLRDYAYLKWRLQRPNALYSVYSETEAGRTVAFGVAAIAVKHGAKIGYVMELMVSPGTRPIGSELLGQMVRDLTLDGADFVLSWCPPCGDLRPLLTRHGFLPFPHRLRPVKFHFGAVPIQPGIPVGPRSKWYLSYLDSDTV